MCCFCLSNIQFRWEFFYEVLLHCFSELWVNPFALVEREDFKGSAAAHLFICLTSSNIRVLKIMARSTYCPLSSHLPSICQSIPFWKFPWEWKVPKWFCKNKSIFFLEFWQLFSQYLISVHHTIQPTHIYIYYRGRNYK